LIHYQKKAAIIAAQNNQYWF